MTTAARRSVRELEQAPQRVAMIGALPRDRLSCAATRTRTIDRRARDDDAVVILRCDAPTREVRRW
jgi:hypothetical protein